MMPGMVNGEVAKLAEGDLSQQGMFHDISVELFGGPVFLNGADIFVGDL